MRKITIEHLKRKAIVYVRQSSLKQVKNNQESQAYQRALEKKALELGWPKEDINIVDTDLGISARNSGSREGFETIVSDVSLSRVGIVFGYEVSRIARNCADWYKLIELCSIFGTLIGDVDGIYNPNDYNDRLLLGLKGTMSEAELHILNNRLQAGMLNKAKRGELAQGLPTGYIRDKYLGVIKDPDLQVQKTIELIFQKFTELGSCFKLLKFLNNNEILIPRLQKSGLYIGELLWKKATYSSLQRFITNPTYAGAFSYGKRQAEREKKKPGHPYSGNSRKPMEQWISIVENKYPQYISWEQYIKNKDKLKENKAIYSEAYSSKGIERNGCGLLQGIAYCGECGRTLRIIYVYKSKHRYICDADNRSYGIGVKCSSVHGKFVDQAVEKAFLEAMGASELNLLERFIEERQQERNKVLQHWEQRIMRLEYEEKIAKKRYRSVDPENRLVAAELEKDWEEKLKELLSVTKEFEEFKSQKEIKPLEESVKQELKELSKNLPNLWYSGKLSNEQKKRLLRTLVEKVLIKSDNSEIEARIIWVSGYYTTLKMTQPVFHLKSMKNYSEVETIIKQRFYDGFKDGDIAEELNDKGFMTARMHPFNEGIVINIRRSLKLFPKEAKRKKIRTKYPGCMTTCEAAKFLKVPLWWLYEKMNQGKLSQVKDKETGLHVIQSKDLEILRNELIISQNKKSVNIKDKYIGCMKTSDAAKLLGKHVNWVHNRINWGKIKPKKDEILGHYIITPEDFEILKRDIISL